MPIALPHHGRVALVTGVSRRVAIDAAIARRMAADEATVLLTAAAIDLSYAVNTRGALRLSQAFAAQHDDIRCC
jgi:NAD(P)-dependent dehydrogenase (short-subunit alcohol dehydrogenase family)